MSKPAIVFVHGSWHPPDLYSPTLSRLRDAGYSVIAPKLPTVRNDLPVRDYWEDVEVVRNAITEAIEGGKDVMVVAHSYGGHVSTQAPEGLLKKDREAQGLKNGVVGVVYIAGFALGEGEHIGTTATWPEFTNYDWCEFKENGQTFPWKETVVDILYQDMPREEGEALAARLEMHNMYAGGTPLTYAAWKHVPCTYLVCTLDKGVDPAVQERMASRLGDDCTVERIDSGHTPTNSRPEEVTALIRTAAGEVF